MPWVRKNVLWLTRKTSFTSRAISKRSELVDFSAMVKTNFSRNPVEVWMASGQQIDPMKVLPVRHLNLLPSSGLEFRVMGNSVDLAL